MQTSRKAVRYYIDREADTPVIRSVPVSRPSALESVTTQATFDRHTTAAEHAGSDATAYAASESRRRDARRRLASLVQSSVRRRRAS